MHLTDFKLERYFAKYEFSTKYLLSSSDCDGYPLQYVLDCATPRERRLYDEIKLGYTDSSGSLFLREAIARQYKSIAPDQVVVTSPGEANFALMNVLLQAGDHVICMSPAYQSLYQIAEDLGARVSYWKPHHEHWYYDVGELEKLVTPSTKLLIVNFPHNPTGFIPTCEEQQKLVAIAEKHNIVLFADEMYHQRVHDEKNQIPAFCDLYENAVSLWGMAKSFGLAGLRMGWLASHNQKLLQKVLAFKDYLTICNNPISEALTAIALNHKEKFIEPNLNKIRANIALFERFAHEEAKTFLFQKPKAGSTSFVQLVNGEAATHFSERVVQEAGIMLLPSEMFDYGTQHLRVGFGRASMPEVLEVLKKYLSEK
ncbi:MAG: aminotransferase class I/II-fold pyridoxal phosphate-dependent enzyme [Flammeovirgaceae bacterium]